jgi:O-antigen ligase
VARLKKAPAGRKNLAPRRAPARVPRTQTRDLITIAALGVSIAVSSLFFDSRAEAAFEAPKRFAALLAITVAAFSAFSVSDVLPQRPWRNWPSERLWSLILFGATLCLTLIATLTSSHRTLSLDATRTLMLFALLLPLGASQALDSGRARVLLVVFLAACAINAAASILQAFGMFEPFAVESIAGRVTSVGFVGNEGYLAILMSLAAAASLSVALLASSSTVCALTWCAVGLFMVALAITRDVTGWIALFVGVLPIARERLVDRRTRLSTAAAVLILFTALGATPPVRGRLEGLVRRARAGQWDSLLSYRCGPWAAGLEMVRDRPLLGFGPGTYEAEFVPHRLRAEIYWRHRFVTPDLNSSYAQAHCDYLQTLAEAGIPAGLSADLGFTILLIGLFRHGRGAAEALHKEGIVVLALLLSGAAAALSWSPVHEPALAIPLLLSGGRAWRLIGETD